MLTKGRRAQSGDGRLSALQSKMQIQDNNQEHKTKVKKKKNNKSIHDPVQKNQKQHVCVLVRENGEKLFVLVGGFPARNVFFALFLFTVSDLLREEGRGLSIDFYIL